VWLKIGMLGTEEFFRPRDPDLLGGIDLRATAVVAPSAM
jgi:hypothetical protein